FLRERDTRVRLYAVEPEECALLARREWGPHGIEGIGDGFIPENLDVTLLSGVITTTTAESLAMARRLAADEGIFCGISTGCNVAAALKLAQRRPDLPAIVTMANDTGQRYFTTALCGEDKHVEVPEREHPMDPRTRRDVDRAAVGRVEDPPPLCGIGRGRARRMEPPGARASLPRRRYGRSIPARADDARLGPGRSGRPEDGARPLHGRDARGGAGALSR